MNIQIQTESTVLGTQEVFGEAVERFACPEGVPDIGREFGVRSSAYFDLDSAQIFRVVGSWLYQGKSAVSVYKVLKPPVANTYQYYGFAVDKWVRNGWLSRRLEGEEDEANQENTELLN